MACPTILCTSLPAQCRRGRPVYKDLATKTESRPLTPLREEVLQGRPLQVSLEAQLETAQETQISQGALDFFNKWTKGSWCSWEMSTLMPAASLDPSCGFQKRPRPWPIFRTSDPRESYTCVSANRVLWGQHISSWGTSYHTQTCTESPHLLPLCQSYERMSRVRWAS